MGKRENYSSCEKVEMHRGAGRDSHLCYSDALWVELVENVIGQHQIDKCVFIHMHSEVLAVVP